MTIVEMLEQLGIPPLLGALIVMGFLIILARVIIRAGRSSHAGGSETTVNGTAVPPAVPRMAGTPGYSGIQADVIAAICAAVNEYRKAPK